MRDKRFVAVHRGGPLTGDQHRLLIRWARACSEHLLSVLDIGPMDDRLLHALQVAKEWEQGNATVGAAMKASLGAHAVARETADPVVTAVARSIGHAVATAHMADHSMGAPLYALKALKMAGKPLHEERVWQNEQLQQLPADIVELVSVTMEQKEKSFKI